MAQKRRPAGFVFLGTLTEARDLAMTANNCLSGAPRQKRRQRVGMALPIWASLDLDIFNCRTWPFVIKDRYH